MKAREKIEQDGYVVFRQVLTDTELGHLRDTLTRHFELHYEIEGLGRHQPNAAFVIPELDWLIAHPSVRALFSGHDNFNGATNWNGQDPNNNLIATRDAAWPGVELFRVDSPMKGDYSGVSATTAPLTGIGDETKLSFQVYSYDIATRRLTEREFLWNPTADATGTGALAPKPRPST